MGKAILVIDEMPSACDECPCCYEGYCPLLRRWLGIWAMHAGKPVVCPLKPMPEPRCETIGEDIAEHETHGWNLCLEEILGETE